MNYQNSSKKNRKLTVMIYCTKEVIQIRIGHLIFNTLKWQRIINCAITLNDTQEEQIELTYLINNLDGPARQKKSKAKVTNIITIRSINELFKGRRILLSVFQSRIFLIKKVNIDE